MTDEKRNNGWSQIGWLMLVATVFWWVVWPPMLILIWGVCLGVVMFS